MKRIALILALMAGVMLPLNVALAKPDPASQSKPKANGKSSKSSKTNKNNSISNSKQKPNTIKYTFEQRYLLDLAIDLIQEDKNYKRAEDILHALIVYDDESNALWFWYGMLFAQQKKCVEATDAFDRVAGAPVLLETTYTPQYIADKMRNALATMDAYCTAKVVFDCAPLDTVLQVEPPKDYEMQYYVECCRNPEPGASRCVSKVYPITPGIHTARSISYDGGRGNENGAGQDSQRFNAIEGQITEVKINSYNDWPL